MRGLLISCVILTLGFLGETFLRAESEKSRVTLVDEIVEAPAGSVKGVTVSLRQRQAVIEISHEASESGGAPAIALVAPGSPSRPVVYHRLPKPSSRPFRFPARILGDYQILVDNRGGSEPAEVRLEVRVAFEGITSPASLSRARRSWVVVFSLMFLLAVGWWSGRRVIDAFRQRPISVSPPPFS